MNKIKEMIKKIVIFIGDVFDNYIELDLEDKFNNDEKEEN